MNKILSTQNEPENIKLLRASTVAYRKAKKGENSITYFLLFLSIAYPICYLVLNDKTLILVLFGCSFALSVLIQIFSRKFKGDTSKGAILKEEFDIAIFKLPWKSTFKKLDRREVLHYSQKYKGNEIIDWYSPKLSESMEHNMAVAILQHTNTSYDIELRKAYRNWLVYLLLFYSLALFFVFVILKTDALTIFLLLFSLLPFFTNIITLIRGHEDAIEQRESISKQLDGIIHSKQYISTEQLRDIQDEIYIIRKDSVKVPYFFFRWHKKQFKTVIDEYIEEINKLYC